MHRRGLRNRRGTRITINGFATLLKNPFYIGLMRIKKSGQTFSGNHEPLVSVDMFENIQAVMAGKRVDRTNRNVFQFSRIVRCATCGYSLIGAGVWEGSPWFMHASCSPVNDRIRWSMIS